MGFGPMRLKMLCTRRGSEDGFLVRRYYEGGVYMVGNTLACHFIQMKWAEETHEPLNEISDEMAAVDAQFDRVFRPASARPVNPATLIDKLTD